MVANAPKLLYPSLKYVFPASAAMWRASKKLSLSILCGKHSRIRGIKSTCPYSIGLTCWCTYFKWSHQKHPQQFNLQNTEKKKKKSTTSTHINRNHAWRIFNINRGIWNKLCIPIFIWFKPKEDLFLPNLGEVEFVSIKGLENLINSKLGRPLLQMTPLIQLGNETILSRNYLHANYQRYWDYIHIQLADYVTEQLLFHKFTVKF